MHYQRDPLELHDADELVDVAQVVADLVVDRRFVRHAVADQIERDQAAVAFEFGHHVAPEVGPGRLPVQEQDRIALAVLEVVHARAEDISVLRRVG